MFKHSLLSRSQFVEIFFVCMYILAVHLEWYLATLGLLRWFFNKCCAPMKQWSTVFACCSTHPDPIWNLEATTIIEHQIKSVLYSLLMISKQKKEKIEPNELGKLTGFGDFNAENYRKSLIQHCERSELRLHFEWTKVN